ncbi:MAG: 4Fe-4S binding protein [Syntrophomonadaceae bacterium]|nr:4Fe-4S binding protein [Syntrophomonadaceae bacterium]
MNHYFHSVTLDSEKCRGCTNCIKQCPTEAIRVRDGKARIIEERCIDCGECIRICPNHAKIVVADRLEKLQEFDYTIALPAPALFGQFKPETDPAMILGGLLRIGFSRVFEVAIGAELITQAIRHEILRRKERKPLISSACPAVVRLMQVRFPGLLSHVIPVKAPMEVSAKMAKEAAMREVGLPLSRIGAFFITPCPAKVTAVKQPVGDDNTWVDGVFTMAALYGELRQHAKSSNADASLHQATGAGMGWGRAGGENLAIGTGSLLSVDGIHSVVAVLEELEKGGMGEIDYIEAQACVGGCIGGPLVVQNPFMARVLIRKMAEKYSQKPSLVSRERAAEMIAGGHFVIDKSIEPRPVMQLDGDIGRALSKMALLEQTLQHLPGLDCGSCGSPHCRALAEDIVRGFALESDCIFKLRERVRSLAEEMVELAQKVPPAMGRLQPVGREEGKERLILREVVEVLDAILHGEPIVLERQVTGAYCSDLLSDAMANAKEGNIWFTIQTHPNVIAVASLLNLSAVVITGGREPDPETLVKAKQENLAVLVTKARSFEAAGKIYRCLNERK